MRPGVASFGISNSLCPPVDRDYYTVDCGETHPVVFEFDRVRGDKEFEIGAMSSMYSSR
jgi:hypothetical protein